MHACLIAIFCWQNLVLDFGFGFRALVPGFIPSQSKGLLDFYRTFNKPDWFIYYRCHDIPNRITVLNLISAPIGTASANQNQSDSRNWPRSSEWLALRSYSRAGTGRKFFHGYSSIYYPRIPGDVLSWYMPHVYIKLSIFSSPRCKRSSLKGIGASAVRFGTCRCTPSRETRKRAKARSQIRNYNYETGAWLAFLDSFCIKMGVPQEKEERQSTHTVIVSVLGSIWIRGRFDLYLVPCVMVFRLYTVFCVSVVYGVL